MEYCIQFWQWEEIFEKRNLVLVDTIKHDKRITGIVPWTFMHFKLIITTDQSKKVQFWTLGGHLLQEIQLASLQQMNIWYHNWLVGIDIGNNSTIISRRIVPISLSVEADIQNAIADRIPVAAFKLETLHHMFGGMHKSALCITSDKKQIWIGANDGSISVYTDKNFAQFMLTKSQLHSKFEQFQNYLQSGSISSLVEWKDENCVISTSRDGSICFWSRSTGDCLKKWKGFKNISTACLSPHENKFLFADEGQLYSEFLSTASQKNQIFGSDGRINQVFVWRGEHICVLSKLDGVESFYSLVILKDVLPWKYQRLLWIGKIKNSPSECLLAALPRDMINHIIRVS